MRYAFVGGTPRHLASGRPLVFGDVVDASDLTPEDQPLTPLLCALGDEPTAAPDPEATEPSISTPEAE